MKKLLLPPLILSTVSLMTACSQQVQKIPEATPAAAPKTSQVMNQASVPPKHQAAQNTKAQQNRALVSPHVYPRNPHRSVNKEQEMVLIGNKIFQNEAGGVKSNLVHWNHGEDFGAMGIGHFTWYPAGPRRHQFGNTFPGLLSYLEQRGERLPAWLQRAKHQGAPWNSRSQLMAAKGSPQVTELENLLYRTRHLQAEYIIQRAQRAMPKLVNSTPQHLRPHVASNLNAVANTPGGWYALVDYVNFKGEGLNRRGGYRGQNWGLLQVLENMQRSQPGYQALDHFADSAQQVLERRIRNSPPSRNETRWLAGWTKRVNTYRYPLVTQL